MTSKVHTFGRARDALSRTWPIARQPSWATTKQRTAALKPGGSMGRLWTPSLEFGGGEGASVRLHAGTACLVVSGSWNENGRGRRPARCLSAGQSYWT